MRIAATTAVLFALSASGVQGSPPARQPAARSTIRIYAEPGHVFAASTTVGRTGRVVVLGDAMATLGTPEGVRLTGVPRDPTRTTYWGKDSAIFMEELISWLIT